MQGPGVGNLGQYLPERFGLGLTAEANGVLAAHAFEQQIRTARRCDAGPRPGDGSLQVAGCVQRQLAEQPANAGRGTPVAVDPSENLQARREFGQGLIGCVERDEAHRVLVADNGVGGIGQRFDGSHARAKRRLSPIQRSDETGDGRLAVASVLEVVR